MTPFKCLFGLHDWSYTVGWTKRRCDKCYKKEVLGLRSRPMSTKPKTFWTSDPRILAQHDWSGEFKLKKEDGQVKKWARILFWIITLLIFIIFLYANVGCVTVNDTVTDTVVVNKIDTVKTLSPCDTLKDYGTTYLIELQTGDTILSTTDSAYCKTQDSRQLVCHYNDCAAYIKERRLQ